MVKDYDYHNRGEHTSWPELFLSFRKLLCLCPKVVYMLGDPE